LFNIFCGNGSRLLQNISLKECMNCTIIDCLLIDISFVPSRIILSVTDIRVFEYYQHNNDNNCTVTDRFDDVFAAQNLILHKEPC
jgi:hypothetical protein